MLFLTVFLFCLAVSVGFGFMAAYGDFRGLRIPNYTALGVALSFFVAFVAVAFSAAEIFQPLKSHILSGLIVFIVTYLMFHFKIMGGGDSKLATAYSFWIAPALMPLFLFYVTFLGAVLGLAALIIKKTKPFSNVKTGSWLARLQAGESAVPYGIPIVIGAILTFFEAGYVSQSTLSVFLIP